MSKRLLTPDGVCLQLIDLQKSLMAKIHQPERVVEATRLMISSATILDIPIFGNTQYVKGLGPYVPEIEDLTGELPVFDKVHFNALANEKTAAHLSSLPSAVSTVVLVGIETHICVYQTAMGLLDLGKNVWVVTDAVSSRNEADHLAGLARMQEMGVAMGPAEMLIYELLEKAGSEAFKKILPHIVGRGSNMG